jgi:hypothetical protein
MEGVRKVEGVDDLVDGSVEELPWDGFKTCEDVEVLPNGQLVVKNIILEN